VAQRFKNIVFLHRRLDTGTLEVSNPQAPLRNQGDWHNTGTVGNAKGKHIQEKQMDGGSSAASCLPCKG